MKKIKFEEVFQLPQNGKLIINNGFGIIIPDSTKRKIIKNLIGGKNE